jgi:hypothetical protein
MKPLKNPKASWESQKAKLKSQFPKLTDEDLDFDETHQRELFQYLEPKLAITESELKIIAETL